MTDPKTDFAPHDCPECGSPAYLGFGVPGKCTNRECQFYDKDLWVEHVMSLPDEETGVELEIEDTPTEPRGLAAWLPNPQAKLRAQAGVPIAPAAGSYRLDPAVKPKKKVDYTTDIDAIDKKTCKLRAAVSNCHTSAEYWSICEQLRDLTNERNRLTEYMDSATL